jgi:hypothetical protein
MRGLLNPAQSSAMVPLAESRRSGSAVETQKRTFSEERARVFRLNQTQLNLATNRAACFRACWLNTQLWLSL